MVHFFLLYASYVMFGSETLIVTKQIHGFLKCLSWLLCTPPIRVNIMLDCIWARIHPVYTVAEQSCLTLHHLLLGVGERSHYSNTVIIVSTGSSLHANHHRFSRSCPQSSERPQGGISHVVFVLCNKGLACFCVRKIRITCILLIKQHPKLYLQSWAVKQ